MIFDVIYGTKVADMHHEYVTSARLALEGLVKATIPGAYWIEYMPFLKHVPSWIPGTSFRKLAEEYKPHVEVSCTKPYRDVEEAMVCVL